MIIWDQSNMTWSLVLYSGSCGYNVQKKRKKSMISPVDLSPKYRTLFALLYIHKDPNDIYPKLLPLAKIFPGFILPG